MSTNRVTLLIVAILLFGMTGSVYSSPIIFSDKQDIIEDGQLFGFEFTGLPATVSAQSNAFLAIFLDGDFTKASETATLTISGIAGSLILSDDTDGAPQAHVQNTIAGLSVRHFSTSDLINSSIGFGIDQNISAVFKISNALLALILADDPVLISVQNSARVNPYFHNDNDDTPRDRAAEGFTNTDADFVQVDLQIGGVLRIPEPTTLSLFAFLWVAFMCRKQSP